MTETSAGRRFIQALRSRVGRKLLFVVLFAALGLVAWSFLGRMPSEGTVEVRWTEAPPTWISLSYTDAEGATVRWRQESIPPGGERFRDAYKLAPGTYWLRVEVRQDNRVRTIRKKVELPTAEPFVLFLEEQMP